MKRLVEKWIIQGIEEEKDAELPLRCNYLNRTQRLLAQAATRTTRSPSNVNKAIKQTPQPHSL